MPPTLGSASTDLLSGLGPPPLAAGDTLLLGPWVSSILPSTTEPTLAHRLPGARAELTVHLGPRQDWLSEAGLAAIGTGTWSVTPDCNRIALRLDGPPLERRHHGELPTEGLVNGAVQALPDGQLAIFLADHPTTGGYPVVAVVDPGSLGLCAQLRPGAAVTFRVLPAAGPDRIT